MPKRKKDQRKRDLGVTSRICDESCPHANEVADKAVKRGFAIIGVNVDRPEQVEKFRQELRFGGALHSLANKGIVTMVVVVASALVASVFYGIAMRVKTFMGTGQ